MLHILQSKTPGIALDTTYLDRLKTIPHSVFDNELAQLSQSAKSTSSALAQAGTTYSDDFAGLSGCISEILDSVDALEQSSVAARVAVQKVALQPAQAYAYITLLLERELQLYMHLDQVQELIQIPELARTCVESGMYAPAYDIFAFVGRLATRHPKSTIIARIHEETQIIMLNMRDILVKLLRDSSKLQVMIKVLTLLRKMEPFKSAPSKVLETLFIESRFGFMCDQVKLLSALESSNSSLYLKRYIELFREHVSGALSAISSVFGTTQSASKFARVCVKDLARTINIHSPRITEDRPRVLLQLTYCSYSLGRVGIEFWPLLECELDEDEWAQAYRTQQALSTAAEKDHAS